MHVNLETNAYSWFANQGFLTMLYFAGCAISEQVTLSNAPASIRSCFPLPPSSAGVPITVSYWATNNKIMHKLWWQFRNSDKENKTDNRTDFWLYSPFQCFFRHCPLQLWYQYKLLHRILLSGCVHMRVQSPVKHRTHKGQKHGPDFPV